ncbi:hypothetical protein P6166_10740 [Stenotrophomonas sp. HITSZ_GD]|uniref:hypothetical protein n=1 Tax=Stenotrophomonas sp. HITSZ_GD TaxID=3037248 RepID=UPI00240D3E47|nr:hypothetical protein [Stenotrophomonas sp. HITSZ_GD]MDG2525829.1 hypothetical protein [Stenotrophomonas sp. HITSZ_GD]
MHLGTEVLRGVLHAAARVLQHEARGLERLRRDRLQQPPADQQLTTLKGSAEAIVMASGHGVNGARGG